jgi:hexosaminidase
MSTPKVAFVNELSLVPAPARVTRVMGAPYLLGRRTRVVVGTHPDSGVAAGARVIAQALARLAGTPVPVIAEAGGLPGAVEVRITQDRSLLGLGPDHDEVRSLAAYRLEVSADHIVLTALGPPGLLNAFATLEQTAESTDGSAVAFPPLLVQDAPRFGWRGLSVDVARHFFDVAAIKSVVEVMSSLKLNMLHLHLTDDQGWRVQLPSRPELTERSGATAVGGDPGGFFTVEDLAEITAYAENRCITVVPEIDLPGHVNAALHAIGELTPSGEPTPEYTGIDVGFSRLHLEVAATEPFLRDVIGDLAAMTPGPYVHIGGDEVLTMDLAEYSALVELAARYVRAAGKKVVGWQEIAKANLGPDTIIQFWSEPDGTKDVIAAVQAGASLLLSPGSKAYLDMKYDAATPLGLEWAGHIDLRDAYDWDPLTVIPGIPPERIIGIEAAIFSETIRTPDDLFYLLLPRLAAVAEVAWSPPHHRDWNSFAARLRAVAPRWTQSGLTWHRSPQIHW